MDTLIVVAHPRKESLTNSVASNYKEGLQKKGNKVTILDLYE
ncbi:NAD(P)H-dependent oxidoreductase [Enterococcus faecalis]